ncbi:uncharacterized protein LOC133897391 [Phragmites australis]|uniref:uncharacterized protein LOC133897391 n=1 Tax=Phragmites australis TaxID=29695 RepID=UPI002D77B2DB|nr:uncharacterized protein LOC133897391 [Phragmites australis]
MGALLHAELFVAAAAEFHLQPGVVACIVLAVAALFHSAIHSLTCFVASRPAQREPEVLLRPTATAASAPTGSASRLPLHHFIVLCLAMGAVLHPEPLVAAAEQNLHPAVFVCVVLAVAALFQRAVLYLNFLVARRAAEGKPSMLLRPTGTGGSAQPGTASRSPLPPFIALCLAMSALMHLEPIVDATAELHLHPAVVPCVVLAVAALFHWTMLSLNLLVARRRSADRQPMMHFRPTDPAASAFLVLAALMSSSWSVEPFAAAATELGLPSAAAVVTVVFFAALFNVSIHIFRSFFLPRPAPGATDAAAQLEGFRASTVAIVGMGVAACLVAGLAAGGSARVYAAARS